LPVRLDLRTSAEPFASREFVASEPFRVLTSENCSPRLELGDSESARDLTNIVCSVKPEVEPSAALKLVARPLASVPAAPTEPVRDRNNDVCSAKLAVEPIDALKFTVRPLNRELERPSDPVRDLNTEM